MNYQIEEISPEIIQRYFTGIFQSHKVVDTPPIQDAFHRFTNYDTYIHILDQDITIKELNEAIDNIGTGTSLDGISPDLAVLFPMRLREVIVMFFNKVYSSSYPMQWQEQLLFPHPKTGHKTDGPETQRNCDW